MTSTKGDQTMRKPSQASKQSVPDELAKQMTNGLPPAPYFDTYRTSYIANYMTMYLRTAKPTFVKEPK
jgi:hypothetical protein